MQLPVIFRELVAFAKRRDEMHKVIYAATTFVMFVAKSNEIFSICDGFSKINKQRHVSGQ